MAITYKNVDVLGGEKVCMALLSGGKKVSALEKKLGKRPKLEQGEALLLIAQPKLKNTHVVLMSTETKSQTVEKMRDLGGKFFKESRKSKANKLAVSLTNFKDLFGDDASDYLKGFIEGALLSDYTTTEGKSKPKKSSKASFEIYHKGASTNELKALKTSLKESAKMIDAVHFTRRLGDLPGNMMTPTILADNAASLKASGLKVTVWDKKKIEKENMGCLLGVN
ncbi:MAG: M17 family peptidase N-terminal domain-containing protein, partial [Bdellovibrionales bacterium]